MLSAVASSPLVVNISESMETYATPEAARTAPPVADELSQPRPVSLGGFEQGQAATPLTPGVHRLVKLAGIASRTNMSIAWFVSLDSKLLDALVNETKRP